MATIDSAMKSLEKKQFQEAKEILEELLKNNPEDVNVLYNLGICYTELNRTDQAIATLNKCVELAPKHSRRQSHSIYSTFCNLPHLSSPA